jgi:pimeloyl-ACP methyl ester carboxylesterase
VSERFVTSADGVRIAVYEQGERDAPTLVLVHGWPDSHVLWDGVVPLLADRFHVVTYDNRGVGKSDAPKATSAFSMARYADERVQENPWTAVGIGFGAGVVFGALVTLIACKG